jgi:hypothetical protein
MIITAIVVGLAFSVLRLVQKQIYAIQKNFDKTTTLVLFEQKMWQDFNELHTIQFDSKYNSLILTSEIDTVNYTFRDNFILRNKDTIQLQVGVSKLLFNGKEVKTGYIDALSISGEAEIPNYEIFISKKNDLTFFMNQENGL